MTSRPKRPDDGFSLIELVIVIVLLGVLGGAVALIFINSWRTQANVTATTEATNSGQLVGQSIERAVRNGIAATTDGTTLWVRTVYGAGDPRQCQRFWVSGGNLFMASSATDTYAASNPWAQVENPTPFSLSTDGRTVVYSLKLEMVDVNSSAAPVNVSGTVALRTAAGDIAPCWP